MVLWSEVRPAIMLQVVAPYVAEMLHLKALTINRVAGVAGFQTMSTCKLNINSLPINVIVVFLLVFCALHHFTASLGRDQPASRTSACQFSRSRRRRITGRRESWFPPLATVDAPPWRGIRGLSERMVRGGLSPFGLFPTCRANSPRQLAAPKLWAKAGAIRRREPCVGGSEATADQSRSR